MKHKLYNSTNKLSAQLNEAYQPFYQQLLESINDENYTRHEVNFFLRKTLRQLLKAQQEKENTTEFTRKNKKKWAVEENKTYKQWHEQYSSKMKECDRITYAGFFAMVAYSLTLIAWNAYQNNALSTWLWPVLCLLVTLILLGMKILWARKLKLSFVHTYGDILMFALISVICYFSTVYFIIFLWIYEVAYMLFLQFHVVEEDL